MAPRRRPMPDIELRLVDETGFEQIPAPAARGARCQTCDYWERQDGGREAPDDDAPDRQARESLKRQRLLGNRASGGPLAMLASVTDAVDVRVVGYAQFGPLAAYPRAQAIRDRYPQLPESPSPWVVTCLQVDGSSIDADERMAIAARLLEAVCDELDRRGIIAVEAYPEGVPDAWVPSPGPPTAYEEARFERLAGDDRFPVYRRELSGETDADAWGDLLRASTPSDEDDAWPLPLPPQRDPDDVFRLPPDRPKRPNPFGDD
jgi:hypothetical protein